MIKTKDKITIQKSNKSRRILNFFYNTSNYNRSTYNKYTKLYPSLLLYVNVH